MKNKFCFAAAASLALSGCGGGGSGSSPQVNAAPQFTSAASASVVENTSGSFYTATATDANGDALTYSIGGGADAAAFAITGDGKLSFKVAPNFEAPADSGANNVYNVDLSVSDGKSSTTLPLAVTVTNSKEGVSVKRIATGLGNVTGFTVGTSSRDLFVYDRDGSVFRVSGDTGSSVAVGNVFQSQATPSDHHLLTMASLLGAPAAYGNGLLVEQLTSGTIVLRSFSYDSLMNWTVGSNAMAWTSGVVSDDNTAAIAVSADHKFYVAMSSGNPGGVAGNLYRVELDPDPYAGASPNFFLTYQVGTGVHQPNGASLYNSRMLFADRGGTVADEINAYAQADSNIDFGWPNCEGVGAAGCSSANGITAPILQMLRGTGTKDVSGLVGGQPYNGAIPGITGDYVFGDKSGKIFTVPLNTLDTTGSSTLGADKVELRAADFAPDAGTLDNIVAIGFDNSGVLYILDGDGELYRVDQGPS